MASADHGISIPARRIRAGGGGRLRVNMIASVLGMFTLSRHRVKYVVSRPTAWVSRREIVSGRHDSVNTAVSSANRASCTWGLHRLLCV